MNTEISIALIDDHTIVRNGLKSLIEVLGNYKVIAEFDNGRQFIEALPCLPPPGLAIMDLNMPEMSGAETMAWLRENSPGLRVLILTLDTDDKTIIELYRMGVRGYLPKSCTAEVLKKAIEDTVNTGYYHSELIQNALAANAGKIEYTNSIMGLITDRELLFLRLLCDEKEYTYEQIATMMGIHKRTVDGYREQLCEKLAVRSKTGLVLFAIKHELVKI